MPDRPEQADAVPLPFLPYGRQEISDADVKAVVEALCSGWLTTGPRVHAFEKAFANFCGAREGVAVNSGTAALHAAMRAMADASFGIGALSEREALQLFSLLRKVRAAAGDAVENP